jgi:hypothetical protein
MLDLPAQSAFFLPCLTVLTEQVVEPVCVCVALSPEFRKAVVDTFGIGVHAEQF